MHTLVVLQFYYSRNCISINLIVIYILGKLPSCFPLTQFDSYNSAVYTCFVDVERIDSSRILPQSGCEDWGYGYVLITTKEGSLVEKGGSVFSDYYYLDHGFSEEEGIKFLTSTCGINNDDELSDAKKLIKNLEGIPLSVAA